MSTHEHSRRAHELVDAIKDGYTPDRADVDFLRSFLPELPKQKTLEEITAHVYDAWLASSDREFNGNEYDPGVAIEDWLLELHKHLKELKDISVAVPALPVGMRLADHPVYGRVVASPGLIPDGRCQIFVLDSGTKTGVECEFVHPDTLMLIDAEPAKPARPEFLETEADYQNAPVGTVAIREGGYPWTRIFGSWVAYSRNNYSHSEMAALRGKARILRWGDGK